MPDYSTWGREISEGSEERRVDKLEGIIELLDACDGDRDNEDGPHVLLVKETEFVAALVSLACDSGDLGCAASHVLNRLAVPEMNRLPLLQFPGLLDALIATPHEDATIATLTWLSKVKDEAQQVAMATNTALVDLLVANVGRNKNACAALFNLCSSDNNRALLYEHPGLIAAVTDATRVPAIAFEAVGVLGKMTYSTPLKMPMLRNPLVLDALLCAAGSDIDEVSDRAIDSLYNLSESENLALMRDDVRIIDVLTARMDNEDSKETLLDICYIGDLPDPEPTLDLSLLCSRPFHHQLSLVKALIREHPEQLSVQDEDGRTPLALAQAAPLPAPIIGLLSDCLTASTLDDDDDISLAHLVGYKRSQIPLVLAQRRTLMCCLVRLSKEPAQPAVEDSRGALNPGKALKGYLIGGIDPWSLIGPFAF
ncbi:hypothetical protein TeGR_g15087 [Tetraparma gracilis]|uniref:Uncharacterized protein n=1 Tax=Tetraparma gracilis TaxID=2962635 RepID=A0ABQ6MI44_9STRA|nr:hypothetical protein TeGR_g15087 [Tetraparma gracilis]